ncbi:hypothetical protein CTAYLR_002067 [Chrysophaeum taylorii]|uniref:Plastid lipid-associated protein/fibrillin conserved domain-containing protein n=1 Tax=Chrysophaeum taylorii TaxID=2483200 RepID=A0AAD7UNC1_9STRA|nr:hypothetical protein CTAYLR_002067 [Chrysophaeum taylorii]
MILVLVLVANVRGLQRTLSPVTRAAPRATIADLDQISTPSFGATILDDATLLKAKILQLASTLDRGQGYNPTSGEQYKDRMARCVRNIEALIALGNKKEEVSLERLEGAWELVFASVKHGIFRSSPFFLAIDEAYRVAGDDPDKAELFFKLHELQTCSWGVSKIGRVGQTIDPETNMFYSTFDTQIFALTVIPIIGWFKLLPTFGGCVVTAAKILDLSEDGALKLEVDYTTAKPVEGLAGLGDWIWNVKVPVGAVWRLLPWNRGRPPLCDVKVRFLDDDFRIVQDAGGDYFVYTRPVDDDDDDDNNFDSSSKV